MVETLHGRVYPPTNSQYRRVRPGDYLFNLPIYQIDAKGKKANLRMELNVSSLNLLVTEDLGGGAYGRVLAGKDPFSGEDYPFVFKTTLPDDRYLFWRILNRGFREFSPQVDELSAQLDHLSVKLIHDVLPVLSDGKFYSPKPVGFAKFPSGYVQLIEKLKGHGPRLNVDGEVQRFKNAQKELRDLALSLGLEHAAQIDPDNPFALANLWLDEKNNRWVWLDTLPAVEHTGWVQPLMRFSVHYQYQDHFYDRTKDGNKKRVTFNKIHIDQFLAIVKANKDKFRKTEGGRKQYKRIIKNAKLYQKLWEEKEARGRKDSLALSPAAFSLARYFKEFVPNMVIGMAKHGIGRPLGMAFSANYRRKMVLEPLIKAHKKGLVTDEELNSAYNAMDTKTDSEGSQFKRRAIFPGLYFVYGINDAIYNPIKYGITGYSLFTDHTPEGIAKSIGLFAIGTGIGGVLRATETLALGVLLNTNTSVAALYSLTPGVGEVYAPIAQVSANAAGRADLVWHYGVREFISNLSRISLTGGSGSLFEARLYGLLGRRIENLARPK